MSLPERRIWTRSDVAWSLSTVPNWPVAAGLPLPLLLSDLPPAVWVGEVVELLSSRFGSENTTLLLLSDHGETLYRSETDPIFQHALDVYQTTLHVPAVLWEYQNTAASGPKPGVLTTLPIGIAVQGLGLLVLAINGGMATMGALSSSSTANAKRMAKKLADSVEDTLGRITRKR